MSYVPYDEELADCTRCEQKLHPFERGKESSKNNLICLECFELAIDSGEHAVCLGCDDVLAMKNTDTYCERCEKENVVHG